MLYYQMLKCGNTEIINWILPDDASKHDKLGLISEIFQMGLAEEQRQIEESKEDLPNG